MRRTCLLLVLLFSILLSATGLRHNSFLVDSTNRMIQRRLAIREENSPKICYGLLGCFGDSSPRLPLKRRPQHPDTINTRFMLYTRNSRKNPDVLEYGDNYMSMTKSKFDGTKKLKVTIHGYKGSGTNEEGGIAAANAFLDLEDVNVIVLDWTKGAGTTYAAAVANTELVGRQLGLILLDAIHMGVAPKDIHVVGFSLGAHVAGCASEVLKKRNLLLGRVTGLDPASPFFRNHLFRERSRKLDASDARVVDVIHTDGSIDFIDGFGLYKPIGHVDFFPNGGREQPGCNDVKNAVVVTHLNEDALDISIACSHLRGWYLFVESLKSQLAGCKFVAWPCTRRSGSYNSGHCFPMENSSQSQEMGFAADHGPSGVYYLPTRASSPFCGEPLRAGVSTSEGAPKTSGVLYLKIENNNSSTIFKIYCDLASRKNIRTVFYDIQAAEYGSTPQSETLQVIAWFKAAVPTVQENNTLSDSSSAILFLDEVVIENRKGKRLGIIDTAGSRIYRRYRPFNNDEARNRVDKEIVLKYNMSCSSK